MSNLVRGAALTNFSEVARKTGLDPYRLLAQVGLPVNCLQEAELQLATEPVRKLLELAAQESGVDNFGLLMAESRKLSNLGPFGLVLREEPTVRHALESVMRYRHLRNDALLISLEDAGELTIIHVELMMGQAAAIRQSLELTQAVLFRLLRILLGPAWTPRSVCFMHAAPNDLKVHHRIFGHCVEFNQDFNGVVCSTHYLDAPIPSSDPVMARYAKQYLETLHVKAHSSMAHEVRQLIFLLLPSGRCSIDNTAQHLGVSRRTIHRRLAQDGESFSSILAAVRSELAARHLESGTRPLSEIADLLGFSELSAFSRWFHAKHGCSAQQWRASHRTSSAPNA